MKTILLLITFSFFVSSTSAQSNGETLTNEKIISLITIGIKPSEIINKIKNSSTNFNTSTDDLIYLNSKGVSGDVINEMINAQSQSNKNGSNPVQTNKEIKSTINNSSFKESEAATKNNNEIKNSAPNIKGTTASIIPIIEKPTIAPQQNIGNTTTSSDTSLIQLLKKQIEQNRTYLETTKKQQDDLNERIKQLADVLEAQNNLMKSQTQQQLNTSQQQQENNTKQSQTLVESVNKLGETIKGAKTEEKSWIPKKIGLGLNVFENFRINTSEQSYIATVLNGIPLGNTTVLNGLPLGNAIVLPISTTTFRFEPEVGFAQASHGGSHTNVGAIGAGIFGLHQKGKTNIYAGARIAFHWLYFNNPETTITGISFSPTLGAEYAFAEHFTLGIDESLVFYFSLLYKENGVVKDKAGQFHSISTQTRLILRFYF